MLYTASYFEPQNHHGILVSISRHIPQGFKVDTKVKLLAPNAELLKEWKAKKIDEAEYVQRYRMQLRESWGKVRCWLNSLDRKQAMTLLCYEPKGTFCHRNLVALLVQKHRPDCFGGCDVLAQAVEKCSRCDTVMIPGLDASYCSGCKTWINHLNNWR